MSLPNDVSMEEILLEDDDRDSIEYKILMAYAQRRLSVSKYKELLKNEANVRKSSSLIRRKVEIDHQWVKGGPRRRVVFQGGVMQQHSKKQPPRKYGLGYRLPFLCGRAELQGPSLHQDHTAHSSISEAQYESLQEGNSQHQTTGSLLESPHRAMPTAAVITQVDKASLLAEFSQGHVSKSLNHFLEKLIAAFISHPPSQPGEIADVNDIADKLTQLVTTRSQEPPSDVSFKIMHHAACQERVDSGPSDGREGKDEEKIIQTIVSLLRQSGDQLEKKIKKDRVFYQCFKAMLSYTFFKRVTDLLLEDVSADSTSEPGGQVQCTKVAFTMEVATRLTAVDNHPMNLVLGFGLKYLREHFKPWIQDQGGWEKALSSLDQEEVE
ncbi:PREDICTED: apoptosis facilitator Bcl-2-like protein 14 [Phaethon lepturus]|uniref:apoptosis facilitator Bcl-2-like protein 14 n=1 Tax=Phaethon lepturus TaxID=97097 RepID=UPI0005308D2E|nr:PREDICTED: apoptosis facilitator Bcl-2-like protein 14 [Phaethon lepturus]